MVVVIVLKSAFDFNSRPVLIFAHLKFMNGVGWWQIGFVDGYFCNHRPNMNIQHVIKSVRFYYCYCHCFKIRFWFELTSRFYFAWLKFVNGVGFWKIGLLALHTLHKWVKLVPIFVLLSLLFQYLAFIAYYIVFHSFPCGFQFHEHEHQTCGFVFVLVFNSTFDLNSCLNNFASFISNFAVANTGHVSAVGYYFLWCLLFSKHQWWNLFICHPEGLLIVTFNS